MSEPVPWPTEVQTVRSIAPGEMRLVQKATGSPTIEDLDLIDQTKASAFVALVRWYRRTYGELPDPAEAWEASEWCEVEPQRPELPSPTRAAS